MFNNGEFIYIYIYIALIQSHVQNTRNSFYHLYSNVSL